jgi:hypothetical protein
VIEASFYGTAGGAALRNVGGSFYDFAAERFRGTDHEYLTATTDPWGGKAALDWAGRLGSGEGFNLEAERLVELAEVIDRVYGRASVTELRRPAGSRARHQRRRLPVRVGHG